ncbi:MAG: FAD-binding oxidoreductase [Gemmatimonadaceae bacterium]
MTVSGLEAGMLNTGGDPGALPRDAADVAEAVAQAIARGQTLRVVAGGTWLDAGRPVRADATLDLSRLRGIVEYTPGDLTLTALAGTPLSEIRRVTSAQAQWLSLDPFGSATGTLGATLATASEGPLAATVGRPRDVALGVEVVIGLGERIRAGGRVVKNVAGFDLVRLHVGAWGTLGVLTEATVRLRGRPEVDRTVAVAVPQSSGAIPELVRHVRHLAAAPLAAELLNHTLSSELGIADSACVLLRFSGNQDSVAAQVRAIDAVGSWRDVTAGVWDALSTVEQPNAAVVRVSDAPADLATLWDRALTALPPHDVRAHATIGRGIVRMILDSRWGPQLDTALQTFQAQCSCIVERVPAHVWSRIAPSADDRLSKRMRAALDPSGVFNPGIFGAARV